MAWGATLATPAIADNVDRTSYSTASWTPTPNRLILVFVAYSVGCGAALAPSLSGNSITWSAVTSSIAGTVDGMTLFAGISGASPSTGTLTASFGAVTQLNGDIQVIEVDGANLSGTALDAIVQLQHNESGGSTSPVSLNLPTVPLATSRCFSGWYIGLNSALTERASWTELADAGHTTPTRRLETQWRSDASEQSGSVSGWAGSTFVREIVVEVAVALPPVFPSSPLRVGRRPILPRRTHITTFLPTPVPPVNPVITFSLTQHRILKGWTRRTRISKPPDTSPIPPTTDCSLLLVDGVSYLLLVDGSSHLSLICGSYPPQFQRHRVIYPPRRHRPPITTVYPSTTPPVNPTFIFNRPRPRTVLGFLRRSHPIQTTPPQFNPPIVFAPSQRRIIRAFFRKPRRVESPITQSPAPNPDIIFSPSQRRVTRPFLRRVRRVEAPLTQAVAPNPPIVFAPSQRRVIRPFLRRGKSTVPVRDQLNPPFPIFPVTQRRVQRNFPRRGKVSMPVQPQVILPNPNLVFRSARHPVLALRGILARRGKVARQFLTQNVPPNLAPAIVILDLQTSGVVSMSLTTSASVTMTLDVSASVSITLSSLNYKDS